MAIKKEKPKKILTKQLQRLYNNSDKLFSLLVQNITEYAIFVVDTTGRILTWNEGAERIKGYKEEEILGKKLDIFYTAEDRKKGIPKKNLLITKNKTNYRTEGWRIRKNGELFWADIAFTALYDNTGKLFGFAKLTKDCTERKRAQEREEENEIKFEALFYNSAVCKIITEINTGQIIETNASYCRFIGYSKEELVGKTVMDLNIWVNPLQRDEIVRETVIEKKMKQWELQVRANYNTIKWISANFDIITHHKKPCFLTTFTDITARKELEQKIKELNSEIQSRIAYQLKFSDNKYQNLINQAPDAIFIFNQSGLFLEANYNTAKLLGYSKSELLNMNVKDCILHSDAALLRFIFNELSLYKTVRSEITFINKNKNKLSIDFSCRKLNNDSFMAVAKDITDKKKTEEKLSRSHEEYQRLTMHLQTVREEERQSIAREIHDELGQYLTAISFDIGKLKSKIQDQQTQELLLHARLLLQDTINAVRKIAFSLRPLLIDDLGLVEAIKYHAREFEERTNIPCQFKDFTSNHYISNKNITISYFRVFQEALTNVTRYAQASKVEASLKLNKSSLLLTIKDNGVGFDTSLLQQKKSLGIIGMRERMRLVNGNFKLNSKPGYGTQIIVSTLLEV